jgi:hypothetical protein
MKTKNIPDISYFDMLPEGNRLEAMEWISNQPEHDVDHQPDRLGRWEIRIVLGGMANFYVVNDRVTKQIKELKFDISNC